MNTNDNRLYAIIYVAGAILALFLGIMMAAWYEAEGRHLVAGMWPWFCATFRLDCPLFGG